MRQPQGRYVVGEKAASSLGAATAYAASLAINEKRDTYVRVIGEPRAVVRCEWDGHGVNVIRT